MEEGERSQSEVVSDGGETGIRYSMTNGVMKLPSHSSKYFSSSHK